MEMDNVGTLSFIFCVVIGMLWAMASEIAFVAAPPGAGPNGDMLEMCTMAVGIVALQAFVLHNTIVPRSRCAVRSARVCESDCGVRLLRAPVSGT